MIKKILIISSLLLSSCATTYPWKLVQVQQQTAQKTVVGQLLHGDICIQTARYLSTRIDRSYPPKKIDLIYYTCETDK